jgi:O-succinylbenzoate synthase
VPVPPAARSRADLLACSVAVGLPLRVPFRGLTRRDVLLLPGAAGWGEFGPFAEYDADTSRPWWLAAHEAAVMGWPSAVRRSIPINATVPAVPADQVGAVLALWPGVQTAKVKVAAQGQQPADDLERLAAVRDVLGRHGRVRIDVNAAWDLDTALALLPRYERAAGGLEYVEQPCAEVADLAALRRRLDVPVAADESVRLAADPTHVARAHAADVVVLKAAPLGGVRAGLALAERVALPVVVSSALDSSVGLAAGVALAAALPELPYACGLGTAALLADDVSDDPLLPVDGAVEVRAVSVSPARLARLALPGPHATAWRRRLAAAMGGGDS